MPTVGTFRHHAGRSPVRREQRGGTLLTTLSRSIGDANATLIDQCPAVRTRADALEPLRNAIKREMLSTMNPRSSTSLKTTVRGADVTWVIALSVLPLAWDRYTHYPHDTLGLVLLAVVLAIGVVRQFAGKR